LESVGAESSGRRSATGMSAGAAVGGAGGAETIGVVAAGSDWEGAGGESDIAGAGQGLTAGDGAAPGSALSADSRSTGAVSAGPLADARGSLLARKLSAW
jgi:hypothetical protein